MNVEQDVAAYYTSQNLEERILGMLQSAGTNLDQLHAKDTAAVDNFHVGGHEST